MSTDANKAYQAIGQASLDIVDWYGNIRKTMDILHKKIASESK